MANENIFLFYALIMGIFITFLYDILRIFRRVCPHSNFWVSVEDICFWLYCAAEVFLLMYHESNGTLRWFAVMGALAGMMLYKKLISPFFVKYMSLWLCRLLQTVGKLTRFLLRPFASMAKAFRKFLGKTNKSVSRRRKSAGRLFKKKLTFLVKMLKMTI